MTPQELQQLHLIKTSFAAFLYALWKFLGLPPPTPLQIEIANYLQYGPRRAMVQAFRGIGKSWITAAFVLWLLLGDPQLKILVVSASKDRADAFVKFVKQVLNTWPLLAHLRPTEGQLDRADMFDVGPALPAQAPSLKAVGITGQITGSRADIIIPDDIEVPKNSLTQLMRDRLSEAIKEFDAILSTRRDVNRILYLGTPQTEMSVYSQLPERGFVIRTWTAEFPDWERMSRMRGHLAPTIIDALEKDPSLVGKPTDTRFSEIDLMERKASYGRSGYALQFMLDTTVSDADRYPLKLSDLILLSMGATSPDPEKPMQYPARIQWGSGPDQVVNDLDVVGLSGDRWHSPVYISKSDEWVVPTGAIMFIDPSGRGNDETGYAIVKYSYGMLICTAVGGFKDGYSEDTLTALARLAWSHRVNSCIIEPNYGGGMFNELFKPVLKRIFEAEAKRAKMAKQIGCGVEEAPWARGQKEPRIIDTLEPVMNQHRLVILREVVEADIKQARENQKYSLFYQMTRLTRDRGSLSNDDRIESLAGAVAYWLESMARDEQKADQQQRAKAMDAELKKFKNHVFGRKPKPKSLIRSR